MTNTLNPWRYWQDGDYLGWIVRDGWEIGVDAYCNYRRAK